jgi:hypothetical protein
MLKGVQFISRLCLKVKILLIVDELVFIDMLPLYLSYLPSSP